MKENGTDRKKVITVVFRRCGSVCLLSCLADAGCNVRAVHVHHMMRAEEARRDADFARDFCARRGIAFHLMQVNVPQYARANGLTPEQAARCLRYRALREAAGGGLIAVAHNLNDQAETVLMRLVRGSGTAGLAAMQELSGDIIRPLLYVSRRRIEEYCRKHGLEYVTDSTNLEPDCTRNILRLEVLPMLEKINPDAVKCIVRTSLLAKSDEEYLRAQAVACAETIMTVQGGSVIIDARGLLQLPPALAVRRGLHQAPAVRVQMRDILPPLRRDLPEMVDRLRIVHRVGHVVAAAVDRHAVLEDHAVPRDIRRVRRNDHAPAAPFRHGDIAPPVGRDGPRVFI